MRLLPIVERELRVAARRRSTWWWRIGVALAGLAVTLWLLAIAGETFFAPQRTGRSLFGVLAGIAFCFSLGIGGTLTADCLSSEKREGTLGLLFLTDLRGYDVVLGKLVACGVAALFALMGFIPVLALPLLLGGLTAGTVAAFALLLLNTLLFSLSSGMAASAFARDERRALSATAVILFSVAVGLPLIGAMFQEFSTLPNRQAVSQAIASASPLFGLLVGLDRTVFSTMAGGPGGGLPVGWFWLSQALVALQSLLLLGLSCYALPRSWHEKAQPQTGPEGVSTWRRWWHWWNLGSEPERRAIRRAWLGLNPVAWLTLRHRARVYSPWVLLVVCAIAWLGGALWLRNDWYVVPMAVGCVLTLHTLFKYQVAAEACRRFAEDRRSGALELLLSTPLSVNEIIEGQAQAMRQIFAAPLLVVILADGLLLGSVLRDAGPDRTELIWVFGVAMAVAVLDCLTLVRLGMWQGLCSRNYTLALGWASFWVLGFPWLLFLVISITTMAVGAATGSGFDGSTGLFVGLLICWTFISVLTDLFWITRSDLNVRDGLRAIASDPARDRGRAD